jgi:hypothetical protein
VDLEALRQRIAEILARLAEAEVASLSDEDLEAAQDELLECLSSLRDHGASADTIAAANEIRSGVQTARAEATRRETEAAEAQAAFDAIVAEIEPPAAEGEEVEETPDGEPVAAEGDESAAAAEQQPDPAAESPTAPAEPEPVAAASTPVVSAEQVTAPISRAASPVSTPSLPAVAARARQASPARQITGERRREPGAIKAKLELVGPSTGSDRRPKILNMEAITAAFAKANEYWGNTAPGVNANIPVLHFEWSYPDALDLRRVGDDPAAVTAAIEAQVSSEALVAAGGICAPYPIDYGLMTLGETIRPVAANLPTFQATRGGVRWMDNFTLADINVNIGAGSAVSQYTKQNDIDAVTKPCMTFTCKGQLQAELYALLRCLQFGNWNARFYPEMIDQVTQLTMVAYARYAEMLLLQGISTGSKYIHYANTDTGASFTNQLLTSIELAVERWEHRYRTPNMGLLRVALPDWVPSVVRQDIRSRMAHSNEQFNVSDDFINGLIRLAGADPWYFVDGENDVQGLYASQPGSGANFLDWPSTLIYYLYAEGTWIRMDAGELDLGIVRDSTMNSKNNFQTFFEAWEGLMFRGFDSFKVVMPVCPNGASAGTYTPHTCPAS